MGGVWLDCSRSNGRKNSCSFSEGQGQEEVTCGEKYGWLFKNGDSLDLAMQIKKILLDKEKALSKAEKAYWYVKETYDVSVTARKYLKNYPYKNK